MPQSKKVERLIESVKKQYTGKKVPKIYQKKYGRVYSEEEAKQVGFAIATKKGWKK